MLIAGFIFLLAMLYLGSRYGGIGLGVISGVGLLIEVFVFRMTPTSPPIGVMLIIIAVVTCASMLEAAGGMKSMLQFAERLLRRNPRAITFLGPLVTYTMTILLGTGHAVYSIMPIIGDVALKNGIRPERPMAAASVSSQLAITGSPLSAAVVYYLGQLTPLRSSINLLSILAVTIPATLGGTLLLSLYSLKRGKDLNDDPVYQRRLQDPLWSESIRESTATTLGEKLPRGAQRSLFIFLLAIVCVVVVAMVPQLRTPASGKPISMNAVIQMMMLGFGGIILIATRTRVQSVPEGVVFKSGMVAAVAIFGIAWMSDTYFQHALPSFKETITVTVQHYPWTFALALFTVSVVINSQAATARMVLPVGIALGLHPYLLVALMPACYGYFFIPNYPSDIASCNFDITGTTKIGKYYFNHSFMAPGLIGVISACGIGYLMATLLLY